MEIPLIQGNFNSYRKYLSFPLYREQRKHINYLPGYSGLKQEKNLLPLSSFNKCEYFYTVKILIQVSLVTYDIIHSTICSDMLEMLKERGSVW